jgi:hypothetical protein
MSIRQGIMMRAVIAALMLLAWSPGMTAARVLDEQDFASIAEIKTSFEKVANDMTLALRRPDISGADSECVQSALRELLQISEELASYEYLITIEAQIGDFGDDGAMKSILRFAVDKAVDILATERRRLKDLSDQCARSPLSASKTQQAIGFVDGMATTLRSIRPRL